ITRNHYENFPVASFFIPPEFRPHIAAVYAFARTADDFADVEKNEKKVLDWREQLYRAGEGHYDQPIFQALSDTIQKFEIPLQLLDDLLTAFLWDIKKNRFQTFEELLEYCRFSANPVGRIVLWIFSYRDEKLMLYSDNITTALQLTNFWQDLSADIPANRFYIPAEYLELYRVTEEQLVQGRFTADFELLLNHLLKQTAALFQSGHPLLHHVRGRLRLELALTVAGGMSILEKIDNSRDRILRHRPCLNNWDRMKVLMAATSDFIISKRAKNE
ncbi:MAG: squalene synthase HpnC, partial [Calditrichia bacterium]